MRRLFLFLTLILLGSFVGGPRVLCARETTATRATIAARITRHLKKAGLRKGHYGVAVMRRGSNPRVVFAHDPNRALVPASAVKVLTAATALDLLGPGHRFVTRLTARGRPGAEGSFEGDLVLHGASDPNISGRFYGGDPMTVPAQLAEAVAKTGIRRVTGALVLDEGPIDQAYVHPDWSVEDRQRYYGAGVGGLTFNDNCVDVSLMGTRPGQAASLDLPATAGPWRVINEVTTRGAGSGASGRWVDQASALKLVGRLGPGKRTSFTVPVPVPALFFGGALRHALSKRGVQVDAGIRLARDREDRRAGRLLAEHVAELSPALAVVNQRSQNVHASLLFKACGAALEGQGTWASGDRAVRAMLERRFIAAGDGLVLRDGSGLSTRNRVSAGVLAQVLASFDRDILRGPLLYESLAVAGRSGTLRKRLRERGVAGRVRGKTGTLNDVRARALVGYVAGRGDHPGYVFAILLNGRGAAHLVIDRVVRELCR